MASPGIDHKISNTGEYSIFIGKGVRIMPKDTLEWKTGVILSADEKSVYIKSGEQTEEISFDTILKARLDYAQEVG